MKPFAEQGGTRCGPWLKPSAAQRVPPAQTEPIVDGALVFYLGRSRTHQWWTHRGLGARTLPGISRTGKASELSLSVCIIPVTRRPWGGTSALEADGAGAALRPRTGLRGGPEVPTPPGSGPRSRAGPQGFPRCPARLGRPFLSPRACPALRAAAPHPLPPRYPRPTGTAGWRKLRPLSEGAAGSSPGAQASSPGAAGSSPAAASPRRLCWSC